MKKLLSILTISTTILNGMSAITAARSNNKILINFINNENKYPKLIKINTETVQFITFDDKCNSFMGTKNELYYLKYKKTKNKKLMELMNWLRQSLFIKILLTLGLKKALIS